MQTQDELNAVCVAICHSRKFETGEGTCSFLCLDQLGDARKSGCRHSMQIHGDLARQIIKGLAEYHGTPR